MDAIFVIVLFSLKIHQVENRETAKHEILENNQSKK